MSTRCVERTECLSDPSNIYYTQVALSLKYTVGFCQACPRGSLPDPAERRHCVWSP